MEVVTAHQSILIILSLSVPALFQEGIILHVWIGKEPGKRLALMLLGTESTKKRKWYEGKQVEKLRASS